MKEQNRREFIKLTSLAVAGSMLPLSACKTPGELAAVGAGVDPDYTLKLGLIGCGGRGTGAANQALTADPNVELFAVGDVFEDKMSESLKILNEIHPEKMNIAEERKFLGFDAFQKVLDSGIDVVILTTPPTFRPQHLEAAVNAGVHIFCEKPVAVDTFGYHRVLDAVELAEEKNLNLVSGLCWRYNDPKVAFFNRVKDGELGDITSIYTTYNTGELWSFDRKPEWSDAEYRLRNWLYYTWISGDHLVEQAVHSIDFMVWAMNDEVPVSVMGTGGRQVRTAEKYGNIFDHFALTYEYASGIKGFHFSRQQANCENSYKAEIFGTKGRGWADVTHNEHMIEGKNEWVYEGEDNDMYQAEHDALFAAIRSGRIINQGRQMAHTTMTAIMGRMAAYTGKRVTWEEAINSGQRLSHDISSWHHFPKAKEVAMPGITPLV